MQEITIDNEIIDDVVVLIEQIKRMGLPALLDSVCYRLSDNWLMSNFGGNLCDKQDGLESVWLDI